MKTQSQGTVPYNNFFQPLGAPVSRRYDQGAANNLVPASTQYVDPPHPRFGGNSFDLGVSRDAIKTMHIKNFSFNAGTGGTLTLGGASNGNGVQIVRDASGIEQVQIDNTGIQVFNGDILIQNTSAVSILDSKGIVSVNAFTNDGASSNVAGSTASNSFGSVSGSGLSPLVLTRAARVFTNLIAIGYNNYFYNDNANNLEIQLVDSLDGTLTDAVLVGQWVTSNVDFVGQSFSLNLTTQIVNLPSVSTFTAGTHTMYLQYKAGNAGTAYLGNWGLFYLVLGI